ncbi:restriction endonuclease subunit S [Shewanella algae]|uniref:restriction endonuclease subunit S n=1 Tax=Shewanella algae TaxID=38313 RepID=UPI00315CBED7
MSWPLIAIKDFCQTGSGGTPSRKVAEYYDGDIPWIKSGDLRENVVTKASEFITELAVKKSSAKLVPKGAILLAMYGATVGRMAMLGIDAATNQAVCAIMPDPNRANARYVYYALLNKVPEFLRSAVGGAQPNISQGLIKDTKIPLPPLAEQKRIAAILDKAVALRRKRQQAIDLADQFLRSVFLDMFGDPVTNPKGWPLESLTDFGQFKNGLNYSKSESGHNVYCIGVGDFKAFDRLVGVDALSSIQLDELPDEGYLLEDGDLLFVRSNGNKALVGRCLTVHPNENNVTFSGFCIRYRPADRDQLNSDYLNYCMRMPSMKNAMLKGGQGANIQNISQKTLSSLLIPLPPAELQRKFAHVVQNFRAAQEKAHKAFEKGNDLFNSLSQQAFAGTP